MNPHPETTTSRRPQESTPAYDQPYTWGRPLTTYLAPREVVRLTILRSRLLEHDEFRARVSRPRP